MIRPAIPEDAEQLAALLQRAWLRAYADFVPAERILGDMDARVAGWRKRLGGGAIATWVFEHGGRVVGFASAQPAEEGGVACLLALYVDPPAQGAGVGTRLLAAAEAGLEARGLVRAVLWVFSANEQGRRFYERAGWAFEEGSEVQEPEWAAPAVRYSKVLGARPPAGS